MVGQIDESFTCSKCARTFKNQEVLISHIYIECSSEPYKCSQCQAKFDSKISLFKHILGHKKEPIEADRPNFTCMTCSETFDQQENLDNHVSLKCKSSPYECTKCHRKLSTRWSLCNHVNKSCREPKEDDRPPFKCPMCSMTFDLKEDLKKHISFKCGSRIYVCTKCRSKFNTKAMLDKHTLKSCKGKIKGLRKIKEEILGNFECATCHRTYNTKKSLMKHLRWICQKPATFACVFCNYKAKLKGSLRIHFKNTHLNCERQDTTDSVRISEAFSLTDGT